MPRRPRPSSEHRHLPRRPTLSRPAWRTIRRERCTASAKNLVPRSVCTRWTSNGISTKTWSGNTAASLTHRDRTPFGFGSLVRCDSAQPVDSPHMGSFRRYLREVAVCYGRTIGLVAGLPTRLRQPKDSRTAGAQKMVPAGAGYIYHALRFWKSVGRRQVSPRSGHSDSQRQLPTEARTSTNTGEETIPQICGQSLRPNRVRAVFDDSVLLFVLPQGATLEQLAERLGRFGQQTSGPPSFS